MSFHSANNKERENNPDLL